MIFFSKIRAGALQFVLFIGTVIVLLLFAFILIHHGHSLFDKKTDIMVDLVLESDRVLMESFTQRMKDGEGMRVSGNSSSIGIQTNVNKEYWGLLEKRNVVSKKGKLWFAKLALVGYENPNRYALFLRDDNRPMVIVGNAKITGDAYLPERGIKMGNIHGYGYTRPQLVYGNIGRSKNQLPALHSELEQRLKMMTGIAYVPQGQRMTLKREMILKNSFEEETIVVQGQHLDLDNVTLNGNIIVWATNKIEVRSTSHLRDVILIAPKIEIGEGTRGSFQAISNERIVVGKHCELDYPTLLAVQRKNFPNTTFEKKAEPAIDVQNGARISGSIIYCDKSKTKGQPRFIGIENGALINGEVYCEQSLELKGNVYGSVVTGSFVSFENGSTYLNHLFNGKINARLLPDEYSGLSYGGETVNSIMKWLY